METEQQQQQFYGTMSNNDTISSNQGYNSALQLRLDCDKILSDIFDFLAGTNTYQDFDEAKQCMVSKCQVVGEALANRKGIQSIMLRCRGIFNPQTVQGNFSDERYNQYIKFLRQDIAMELVQSRYKWEIQPYNVNTITNKIMEFAKPFMSRTLYNKERESYTQTVQSKETHNIVPQENNKKGWF